MKDNVLLTITSLLSILLVSLHVTHDIVRGSDSWNLSKLSFVMILVLWLYATLVSAERRSGLIIMLVLGLLSAGMPVIHIRGNPLKSNGDFFFIWTLFAVGATGILSAILAARALRVRRG